MPSEKDQKQTKRPTDHGLGRHEGHELSGDGLKAKMGYANLS